MPDKVIDIPGVGQVAFPDSMSPDDMNKAAAKLYAEKNPSHPPPDPKHSWVDTAVDWLPTAGGAVGGLLGGLAGGGVASVPMAVGGAALGGGVGEVIRQNIEDLRGRQAAPPAGQAAMEMGQQAALQGGAELAGAGVGAVMAKAAPRLMQSAVKPGWQTLKGVLRGENVPRVVQTMLDEGINVTPKGFEKIQTLLASTRGEIKDMLDAAEAAGHEISPYRVASRLSDNVKRADNLTNPDATINAIADAGNEFLNAHGDKMLTPTKAQLMKETTNTELRKSYGEMKGPAIEAQKGLVRGLKEELERVAPGIDVKNARQGGLMQAEKDVGRRVAYNSNKDIGGLATLSAAHPAVFLAMLMDRSPAVKSMVARGMYTSAGAAAKVSPQLIRGAMHALASQSDDQP